MIIRAPKLRYYFLFSFLFVNCQAYNNSTHDRYVYGGSSFDLSTSFGQAMQVVSTRCFQCHSFFATYTTEALWKESGFVVAGSLPGSKLYYRLTGANLGIGSENMPQNGSLTSNEIATLRSWISNMAP